VWYLWNEAFVVLWHFSDSCFAGYDADGQQAGRSHRLRTSRYEYSVTDKPWARLQLIYNDNGTRSLCDNRDIILYYRENSRSSWELNPYASIERSRFAPWQNDPNYWPCGYIYSCIYWNIHLYETHKRLLDSYSFLIFSYLLRGGSRSETQKMHKF